MLDFLKGRKANPPARLLAQSRAMMKAKGLPADWAEIFAPRMETAPEIEELIPVLEKVRDLFEATGVALTEAGPMLEAALEALLGTAGEGEKQEETPADGANMLAAVAAQVAMRKRGENPSNGKFRPGIGMDWNSPAAQRAKMVDGLTARIDRGHTPTVGREFASMKLSDFAMHFARMSGQRPSNAAEAVRMATHSGSDFPLILENAMGKTIARRIALREPDILRAASKKENVDYRPSKSLTLSSMRAVQEVSETGEIKHSTMDEKGESNPMLRDFAGAFTISNKALVNDDLGLFDQAALRMTEACTAVQRSVLLGPLLANAGAGQTMADGLAMFHVNHRNLAATNAPLSTTSLTAARTALRKQVGPAGELLAIEPFALVVPAEQETLAQQVVASIQATKISDVNPFAGSLEIIVEPGLTSATGWYLIADPAMYEGLTWATLEGMDAPRVESRPGWNTLGMEFRVTWAIDAAFTETATWYRNAGA